MVGCVINFGNSEGTFTVYTWNVNILLRKQEVGRALLSSATKEKLLINWMRNSQHEKNSMVTSEGHYFEMFNHNISESNGQGGIKLLTIYSVSTNKKIEKLQKFSDGTRAKCKHDGLDPGDTV